MAASGDVTITQDGVPAKLHPYLVAFVRWCVSCFWSTTTVLLHRLLTSHLPPIAAVVAPLSKPSRPAGKEHLHPEPKVDCEVLHQPTQHDFDVIFVHGLYGSLCNTWRQGEWRTKYQKTPEKVHLRRPSETPIPCYCHQCANNDQENGYNKIKNKKNKNEFNSNCKNGLNCIVQEYSDSDSKSNNFENRNNNFHKEKKINYFENRNNNCQKLLHNNGNITNTDKFTNIDENFYSDFTKILPQDDVFITENFYNNTLMNHVQVIENYETQAQFVSDLFKNCDKNCDVENRDNNVENINNNFENRNNNVENRNNTDENSSNNSNYDCKCMEKCEIGCGCICDDCYSPCWPRDWIRLDFPNARVISVNYTSDPHLWRPLWIKENKRLCLHERAEQMAQQLLELGVGRRPVVWVGHSKGGLFIKQIYCEAYEAYLKLHPDQKENTEITERIVNDSSITTVKKSNNTRNRNNNGENDNNNINNDENINNNTDQNDNSTVSRIDNNFEDGVKSSDTEEDLFHLDRRASLWQNSVAFMFYSVPHRGSPLADIKTPLTARSVELIEISKDNSLVLSLQERWLRASAAPAPAPLVRSVVETRRTLMSVLWLRIVSADSADPGIGALCGVSVDHREICKPSSRQCLLYTELTNLIRVALNRSKTKRKSVT